MYARFICKDLRCYRSRKVGIFRPAYALRRSYRLPEQQYEVINEHLDWFNRELLAPKLKEPRALFWFKQGARESYRRMWKIAVILNMNGHRVEMKYSNDPGRIVFEDKYQVAAVPYARLRE